MIYIVQAVPIGGFRAYPVKKFEIVNVERKPTIREVYSHAVNFVPEISDIILRRATYHWLYDKVCDKGGVGLEIGVDYGDGIQHILEAAQPSRVVGVDPWLSQDWDPWFDQSQETMDCRYNLVVNRFKDDPRVEIVRSTSDDFFCEANKVPTYDWIHIDGDHRTEPAYRDIVNSYHRLKVGGILIIDDVFLQSWTGSTGPAVDKAMEEIGPGCFEVVNDTQDPVAYRKVK